MGKYFTDNFSILHFATGIIFYYFGISFTNSFIIHLLFEAIENQNFAMEIISKTGWWPGGKDEADTVLNSLGDQFYFSLGWIISSKLDYDNKGERGKF
jgi:hypothetical protein